MKWEYSVQKSTTQPFYQQSMLNEMGRTGWELVAVHNVLYYFKRPLAAEEA